MTTRSRFGTIGRDPLVQWKDDGTRIAPPSSPRHPGFPSFNHLHINHPPPISHTPATVNRWIRGPDDRGEARHRVSYGGASSLSRMISLTLNRGRFRFTPAMTRTSGPGAPESRVAPDGGSQSPEPMVPPTTAATAQYGMAGGRDPAIDQVTDEPGDGRGQVERSRERPPPPSPLPSPCPAGAVRGRSRRRPPSAPKASRSPPRSQAQGSSAPRSRGTTQSLVVHAGA